MLAGEAAYWLSSVSEVWEAPVMPVTVPQPPSAAAAASTTTRTNRPPTGPIRLALWERCVMILVFKFGSFGFRRASRAVGYSRKDWAVHPRIAANVRR